MMTERHRNSVGHPTAKTLESRFWECIGKNDVKLATVSCEHLNRQYPDFAPGWFAASHLAMKLNKPRFAVTAIDEALSLQPEKTAWVLQKALSIGRLGDLVLLRPLVERLRHRQMKSAYECSALAMLMTQLGMRKSAVTLYEKAVALKPDEAKHYYNIACLQRSLGETQAAERNLDNAIRLDTNDFEAYKIRSELRKQTVENNHVESLEKLLRQGVDDSRGRTHVCYALAKELEDLDHSERSFHFLKIGADTRRDRMRYDVKRDLRTIASIRQTFTADLFGASTVGHDNSEPIFVLGMPRTGTTLVERILSSHSAISSAGELTNFSVQMTKLVRPLVGAKKITRDEMVRLTAGLNFKNLGAAYIESTRPLTGRTERFIDKLPLNYLYVGLIHLALPNAKIVCLTRDPLDTCYAVYKQLFEDAYPFSYDLEELGHYYVAYHQLMSHWDDVLPGVVHNVSYESLVTDIETEIRRLLEYCGLDWQPQCLKFHDNKEASTTASSTQVRQPIYQSSVGKWRRYRQQLKPLIEILESEKIPLDL